MLFSCSELGKHAYVVKAHIGLKKMSRRDSSDFGLIWAEENIVSGYEGNQRPDGVRAICGVTNLLPLGYQRKTEFPETCGVNSKQLWQ